MKQTKLLKLLLLGIMIIFVPLQALRITAAAQGLQSDLEVSMPSPHVFYKPDTANDGEAFDETVEADEITEPIAMVESASQVVTPAKFNLSQAKIVCVNNKPQVQLAWDRDIQGASFYAQKKINGILWRTISNKLTRGAFTDTKLTAPGNFTYRIRAISLGGIVYSNALSVNVNMPCSTQNSPPPPENNIPPPPASGPTPPTPTPEPPITNPPPPAPTPPTPPADTSPPPTPNTKPPTSISWGASVGWKLEDGTAFEKLVGRKIMNRAIFVHWGNENTFPSDIGATLMSSNGTLTIFWEVMDYNGHITDQPKFSYNSILRGEHDSYIKAFASAAKIYGGKVILIPFSEMNGNWNPWSGTKNNNTPQQHIQAFRHIRDLFTGVSNVKFGWAVNNGSVPNVSGNQIDDYYPGDAYVDYVGVDGFNFANPWQTFSEVFDAPLAKLKKYKKPIYLFSMASCGGSKKAEWIQDAFKIQLPKHPEITGWIWFNENKECDWRINSDQASLDAFKAALP